MAVLVEALSVIIKADSILKKYKGGWEAFKQDLPNNTLCADTELVRVGFMSPNDVGVFIDKLKAKGFVHLENNTAIDLVVIDQQEGSTSSCEWAEYGHISLKDSKQEVAACRLKGSSISQIIYPEGWKYETSLSNSYVYMTPGEEEGSIKILNHSKEEDGTRTDISNVPLYCGEAFPDKDKTYKDRLFDLGRKIRGWGK